MWNDLLQSKTFSKILPIKIDRNLKPAKENQTHRLQRWYRWYDIVLDNIDFMNAHPHRYKTNFGREAGH